jgi:hypothetical protein
MCSIQALCLGSSGFGGDYLDVDVDVDVDVEMEM